MHSTAPILKRWPTSAFNAIPRVTDVAARLLPRQVDGVEHFRLDERQLVAASGSAKRFATVVIPISRQSAAGGRVDLSTRASGLSAFAAVRIATTEPTRRSSPYGSSIWRRTSILASSHPSTIVP